MKHKITTRHGGGIKPQAIYRSLIRQAVIMTLAAESVDMPCVVNVLITDDNGIREYNKKHMGIDSATDVLSFPMQEFASAGWSGIAQPDIDMDTQTVPLGDIVISTTTIKRHARRFGVTVEQETTRMIIHSTMHLLGYDHCKEMREKEAALLRDMGYFE